MNVPGDREPPANHEFFAGNGEMANRMRSFDWSKSSLGPAEAWPQSLKTTVRIMLTSRYAMWMSWGPEIAFFYNDAYTPTLGNKHAWALGCPANTVWAEIWPDIGPRIDRVLRTGEATWDEGLRLFLDRSGYLEETYHTFSYSPLADDDGAVSGMLCVVTEETQRIIGERRLKTLRDAGTRAAVAQSADEACRLVIAALDDNPADVPLALLYLTSDDGKTAQLRAASRLARGHAGWAETITLAGPTSQASWPLAEAMSQGACIKSATFGNDSAIRRMGHGTACPRRR